MLLKDKDQLATLEFFKVIKYQLLYDLNKSK